MCSTIVIKNWILKNKLVIGGLGAKRNSTKYLKLFFFRKCKKQKLIPKSHIRHFELKLSQIVHHRFRTCLRKFYCLISPIGSLKPQYVLEHSFNSKIFFHIYLCKSIKYYSLTLQLLKAKLHHGRAYFSAQLRTLYEVPKFWSCAPKKMHNSQFL